MRAVWCLLLSVSVGLVCADFASMSASIPHLANLRTHTSFTASAPLDDESGHGNHLVARNGAAMPATCEAPTPCHVRVGATSGAGLLVPIALGLSSNGSTVCVRYRVWQTSPDHSRGVVLRLEPIDDDAPSRGSIKYSGLGDGNLYMYTVTDANQLLDSWEMVPTAAEDGAFTHVCLAWYLSATAGGQLRHTLVVGTQTFDVKCPLNDCYAGQRDVPMITSETQMCVGCTGYPEAERHTNLDLAAFAVWDVPLSSAEMRTYIDLVAAQA